MNTTLLPSFLLSAYLSLIFISSTLPKEILPDPAVYMPSLRTAIHPLNTRFYAYFTSVLLIPCLTFAIDLLLRKMKPSFCRLLLLLSQITVISLISYVLITSYRYFNLSYPHIMLLELSKITSDPLFLFTSLFTMIILAILYLKPALLLRIRLPKRVGILLIPLAIVLVLITVPDRNMREELIFTDKTFQYFHTEAFLRPVYEILGGKKVLVDTVSMYGIFLPYIFAIPFLFIPLTFTNFFFLTVIVTILYYLLLFKLLLERLENRFWALLALISCFSFHYYLLPDRLVRPQYFPLRFLFDLPVFLILLKGKPRTVNILLPIILSFSFFYNLETGIALFISYLIFQLISSLKTNDRFYPKEALRKVLVSIVIFMVSSLSWMVLYTLLVFISTSQIPRWMDVPFFITVFGKGFGASSGTLVSFYLLLLFVYLLSLSSVLVNFLRSRYSRFLAFDAGITVYILIMFTYLIVRPYTPNTALFILPAVILSFSYFKNIFFLFFKNNSSHFPRYLNFIPLLAFSIVITYSISFYITRLVRNNPNYYFINVSNSINYYQNALSASALIAKYEKSDQALILGYIDTFYALYSHKFNSIPYNSLLSLVTEEQREEVLRFIQKSKPEYIFAEKNDWVFTDRFPEARPFLEKEYSVVDSTDFLNVWKRK